MVELLTRRKLRDIVADHIKEYIVRERLKAGDRLPTENALAEQFGVSRISVREATKTLEFLGILEATPGRGLTVRQMDIERLTDCLRFHPALLRVPSDQLIDTRVILETGVLPHVAARMARDPQVVEGLQAINDELRRTRELSRFIELDIDFHRALVEASGLAPLAVFNDLLQAFFQRFRESVKRAEWKAGVDRHQQIIEDLQAGEIAPAAAALREHIESHKARIGARS
jgi:GntR family transcriptional repressor for pyruvate dehydrogenase complex